MSGVDLLPCPFCGSAAEIERVGDHRRSTIYQCTFCSCSLETGEEWSHGRGWNERATYDPDTAMIERVARALAKRNVPGGVRGADAWVEMQWKHYCADAEAAIRSFNTTPSQGLDAATVERCAAIADVHAEPTDTPSEFTEAYELAARKIARAIRRLATDPHQHGGKGA